MPQMYEVFFTYKYKFSTLVIFIPIGESVANYPDVFRYYLACGTRA